MPGRDLIRVDPYSIAGPERAWFLDSAARGQNLATHIYNLPFGELSAANERTRELLRMTAGPSSLSLDILGPYPVEGLAGRGPYTLEARKINIQLSDPIQITDTHWSPVSGLIHVLDAPNARLLVLDPTLEDSPAPVRVANLQLPDKVSLSANSRLSIVPYFSEAPEELDSLAFISAPESHVILKADLQTGEASLYAGRPGRKGKPSQGQLAHECLLRGPSALAYDAKNYSLFVVDDDNHSIYKFDDKSRFEYVTGLPESSPIISLLYYDVSRFVSKAQIPKAPGYPLLVLIHAGHDNVYKFLLRSTEQNCQHLVQRIFRSPVRAIPVQNGDLLIASAKEPSFYLHTTIVHPSRGSTALDS